MTDTYTIPPRPLWVQLYEWGGFLKFTYRELARETGVPFRRIHNVILPRSRLDDFLKVIAKLGLYIRITSWEGKLIVPLEDTIDLDRLCKALTGYKDHVDRGGAHLRHWPPFKRRMMVECAFEDTTLDALDRYLQHISASAVLVRVSGDQDGIDRAAA